MGSGFFLDYGRPESALCESKIITFWPDEWKKHLYGVKAIGNYVDIYIPSGSSSVSVSASLVTSFGGQSPGVNGGQSPGVWRKGRIVEHVQGEDTYRVLLDHKEGSREGSYHPKEGSKDGAKEGSVGSSGSGEDSLDVDDVAASDSKDKSISDNVGSNSNSNNVTATATAKNRTSIIWENKNTIKVNLDEVRFVWLENSQRQRNLIVKKSASATQIPLTFSLKDVGTFCRVWWSRYQRFFYGRIVAFNTISRDHKITYEDGDTRVYDMSTKIYELISLPMNFSFTGARDESECAQIVSAWHAKFLLKSK